MPRFDKSKRYKNKSGQRFGKGVWYDDNGKMLAPGWGEFSRDHRTVTQYNTDGTKTTFSWEDWVKKNGTDHELRVLQNDRKYAIPYIPQKKMTITVDKKSPTRKNAGATFSENLLDSIAVNAKKAGLPFGDALGLVAQESTFGTGKHRGQGQTLLPWLPILNRSSGEQKDKTKNISYQGMQSPSLLISNWKQREENPYAEFFYDGKGNLLSTPKDKEYYDNYFRPHLVKGNRYQLQDESPLLHGFKKYKEHPERWNSGDPSYPSKVEAQKQELIRYSPEIIEYMNKNNLKEDGGELNTYKSWNDLSIKEKADMIKVGVKNGLTNMSDIRQKYNEFANGGNLYPNGGWRDIAKYHIRRNEGFRQHSYADAPKGKSWRSVGYGFNDSGFYNKYPMGISKYYDSRGGITRQEAEQELDYMLNIMENQARRAYGSRWNQFNDNQKAAIMDTMYQRPASVLKGSQFYKAVMAGDPNAGNYLGVTGYANRNNIRRGLFGNPQITVPQEQQLQMQQPLIIPYESLNIQAQNTPQAAQQPVNLEALRRQQELDERQQALAERAQAAETRQRGMENLMMAWRMLNEDTPSTDTSNSMPNMLTNNPYSPYNQYSLLAEGGNLFHVGGKNNRVIPQSISTSSQPKDNLVYNMIPLLFAQDGLKVRMTSGYRPGAIVMGTNRKSRHSVYGEAGDFRPENGDYARMLQILNDPNSNVSRWMRANGFGYLNEAPGVGGTTKYWRKSYFNADGTPNIAHSMIHIGKDQGKKYAAMFKDYPLQQQQPVFQMPQQFQIPVIMNFDNTFLSSYQKPQEEPQQPIIDMAAQQAALERQEKELTLQEKQDNMQMFANVYNLLYNSGNNSSSTPTTYTAPNGNPFRFAAYGGKIKTK